MGVPLRLHRPSRTLCERALGAELRTDTSAILTQHEFNVLHTRLSRARFHIRLGCAMHRVHCACLVLQIPDHCLEPAILLHLRVSSLPTESLQVPAVICSREACSGAI